MNRRIWITACVGAALAGMAGALEDPGKSKIGRVCVSVYHATNEAIGLVKSRRSKRANETLTN